MIKALIFDFDGLILDTESPDADAWIQIYAEHGFEFPIDEWGSIIGGRGISNFDAAEHLSLLTQGRLDSASMRSRHRSESEAMTLAQPVMPGVLDYIRKAKQLDLKLGIASSSEHAWVDTHSRRLGILDHFDTVICSDDVGAGRTKPNPDLFLKALNQLRVKKNEAIVFEDSPNGVAAANQAGIFVVAVPNSITSRLKIANADMFLSSLSDLSLTELLGKVQ